MNNKDWTGNGNSVWKSLGASNHTDEERERNDYYATSPTAIDRLLKYEKPSKAIWECAVGGGHLAARLKELGYDVFASDIIDRGYEGTQIIDFLSADKMFCDGDIMTNPPYKYATEFVEKALEILRDGHKCYMFLKLTFLEGKKRYVKIFKQTPPRHVYVFSERVECAKNAEFERMREGGGSAVAYAWFVWEKGYKGETIVRWI